MYDSNTTHSNARAPKAKKTHFATDVKERKRQMKKETKLSKKKTSGADGADDSAADGKTVYVLHHFSHSATYLVSYLGFVCCLSLAVMLTACDTLCSIPVCARGALVFTRGIMGLSTCREWGPDSFKYLKVLGKGSFGKVMLSEHKTSKEIFAIKVNTVVHSHLSYVAASVLKRVVDC